MNVDEGKEGAIHQNSRYHWDNARNGDALVRGMEPMARLDHNDADERRTGKRTDAQTHVETDVAVRWTQIDEITAMIPPTATTGNRRRGMRKMVEKPMADTAAAMANSQYS